MDIYKKIEEIRQKPEHVRMRYVWLCVSISMVFVIAIWIFSLGSGFGTVKESVTTGTGTVSEAGSQFRDNKKSLEDAYGQLKSTMESVPRDGSVPSDGLQAQPEKEFAASDAPAGPSGQEEPGQPVPPADSPESESQPNVNVFPTD